jgi:hypothetical protein
MALQPVTVPITFAGGVETKLDPKAVPPVRLLDLQNGVFSSGGSIKKRNGYGALGTWIEGSTSPYANAKGLARRDDELVLFTDGKAYSHRPDADTWSDAGSIASVLESSEPIARTGTTQSVPDIATNDGVSVVAWEDSRGGVWWAVVEAATGRFLRAAAQLAATGERPRCVAVGAVLHIYYAISAAFQVWCTVVNPAEPTAAVVPALLIDDLSAASPTYDAERTTSRVGLPAAIAWARNGGGYRVGFVDASGVLGSPVTGHPTIVTDLTITPAAGTNIAVAYDDTRDPASGNQNMFVAMNQGATSAVHAYIAAAATLTLADFDTAIAESGTIVRIALGIEPRDNNAAIVVLWSETSAATARDHRVAVHRGGVAGAGTLALLGTQRGAALASRGFTDNGLAQVVLVHETTYFPVYLAQRVRSTGLSVVTRTLPGLCSGRPTRAHLPTVEIDTDDSRVHTWPATYREQLASENGDQFGEVGIRRVRYDFDADNAWQTAQLGRGLYLAASCPLHYDGDRWAEAGFHYGVDGTIGVAKAGGGSMTASSTYLYRFVYEEIDAQGEVHRGPVSIGTSVVLGVGETRALLTIPTYRATAKRRVRIGVFRSVAGGEATLYRVSSLDPSAAGNNGYVVNDTTTDTVPFNDALSDADLITREPLYTNGGILSNDPPAWAGGVLASGKGRLFFTDAQDPHVVRYSQQLELGAGAAVDFPADLALAVPPDGGRIVGLGVLDDAVVVYCETAIFAFGGDGPLANPEADERAGFTPPVLVTSDVGCKSADSIGYTPVGLIFQSRKGIRLLDRSRQVLDIGSSVEAYDEQTITRTTLLPDRSQIVLLTSSGRTLLYDYAYQQWSTFTNHEGLDAVVVDGTYHYLRTDGRVFRETPGVFRDDNSQIVLRLETAWVKFAGFLQGWQRVWYAQILGTYRSEHTLVVRYAIDYEAGWSAPFNLDVNANYDPDAYGEGAYGAGPYGGSPSTSTVYQRRVHIGKRCQSIRFRIEDSEDTADFGASFEISELVLTGGVLPKPYKLGAARSN